MSKELEALQIIIQNKGLNGIKEPVEIIETALKDSEMEHTLRIRLENINYELVREKQANEKKLKSYSKYEGKSVVLQCRKCGHLLYVGINDKVLQRIKNVEKIECPNCGEEGNENWIVRGIDDWNKRKIF